MNFTKTTDDKRLLRFIKSSVIKQHRCRPVPGIYSFKPFGGLQAVVMAPFVRQTSLFNNLNAATASVPRDPPGTLLGSHPSCADTSSVGHPTAIGRRNYWGKLNNTVDGRNPAPFGKKTCK